MPGHPALSPSASPHEAIPLCFCLWYLDQTDFCRYGIGAILVHTKTCRNTCRHVSILQTLPFQSLTPPPPPLVSSRQCLKWEYRGLYSFLPGFRLNTAEVLVSVLRSSPFAGATAPVSRCCVVCVCHFLRFLRSAYFLPFCACFSCL